MKRHVVPVSFLVLAALSGCGSDPPSDPASTLRPQVTVVAVAARAFTGAIEAPGQWKAAVETVVPAPFDAVVDSLTVQPGDRVRRGEVLGWCRTAESDAMARGAELVLREATDAAGRADATRAMAQARASAVRVPIAAPAAGVVLRREAGPGARLAAGGELFTLVADDALVFEIRVGAADAAVLRPGLTATITDGDGPPRAARLWTVPPVTAGDQSALAWLRPLVLPPHPAVGRFGTASIRATATVTQLSVPDSAVVEDDLTGAHRIAVVDPGGAARWTDVVLGGRDGHAQGIRGAGLRAGDAVVVEGQRALSEGMRVEIRR